MEDPVINIVLDSSILGAYLLPSTVDDQQFVVRVQNLIDAKAEYAWPAIRIWIPSIVIAETQAILDKWRHCDWHGPLKADPRQRITKREYEIAFRNLDELVSSRRLDRLEHNHEHMLATSLVSSINAKYQIRRKTPGPKNERVAPPVKPPMGATDCVIIASAMMLKYEQGGDLTVLATADQRQCDVSNFLRKVSYAVAKEIGLDTIADRIGLNWSPFMYPRAVNLRSFSDAEIRQRLHTWPMPNREWTQYIDHQDLSKRNKLALRDIYMDIKSEYKIGVDKLPYTAALDDLKTRFARRTGVYFGNLEIYHALQSWRKAGLLKTGDFD